MLFIIGVLLMCVGGFRSVALLSQLSSMNSFEKYVVGDEINGQLGIWGLIFIVGIIITVVAYNKKRKQDQSTLVQNIQNSNRKKCPTCGLELDGKTEVCPQCNTSMEKSTNV